MKFFFRYRTRVINSPIFYPDFFAGFSSIRYVVVMYTFEVAERYKLDHRSQPNWRHSIRSRLYNSTALKHAYGKHLLIPEKQKKKEPSGYIKIENRY